MGIYIIYINKYMSTNQLINIPKNKKDINRSNSAKLPNDQMVSVKQTYTK